MGEPESWPYLGDEHWSICAAVQRYATAWTQRAQAAESARRLGSDTYAELHACGALNLFAPFRTTTPRSSAWPTLVEASRIAARGCASTGWAIAMLGGHAAIAMRTSDSCKRTLYANGPEQRFASASAGPQSRLRWTSDGIHVYGRWRFSSGIEDATWLMVNAACEGYPGLGPDERVLVLVERRYVLPLGSWQASGMCATGSHDVDIDHIAPLPCATPLSELFEARPASADKDYLRHVPIVPYITTSIIGPLIGATEGARDAWLAEQRTKAAADPASTIRMAERLAHIDAQLASTRLLYQSLVGRLHEAGVAGRTLDELHLRTLRRDRAYLASQCVDVMSRIVQRAGASAFTSSNPVQRHWRDVQVMASHRDVAWEAAMTQYGVSVLASDSIGFG
ncbi:hypothetical protein [Burkholderia ubonensis]|uniref:hypothetical protein n=1 Tax=Burkholderia ubonensis TaxID=101571 RepID=UPI0007C855D9|nr:hypothetical protein [Burkholderia ubonensis]